jgi:hypothetical protein
MLLKIQTKSTANAESQRRKVFLTLFLGILLVAVGSSAAQAKTKRLIMKDGTYQVATKWEVKGDRVRYYSAERYEWEEIPTSLVDWNATEKWDKETGDAANAQAAAQIAADKAEEEAATPTVAPGLRLPEQGGVFLLDQFGRKDSLVELVQNSTQQNKHTGKNILRAVVNPLPSGTTRTMDLPGAHARVQSHLTTPQIFVNINYDDDSGAGGEESVKLSKEERFKVVRVKASGKDKRSVADLKISLLGSMKEQRNVIPTIVEAVGTDWVKVTPTKPLGPGEYALVEMLTPKQMNLYVWDFGVNPAAPANPTAWKPQVQKASPTVTDESPVMNRRPKN